ncbi:MAG: DivIVA domain-containing protein [Nitrospirota bacterium]
MKITPLDIQQKQFRVKFRGFDVEEVDSFLEMVREEFEELLRENSRLREELHKMENHLSEYKETEMVLKNTLMTTQQMIEEIKGNAQKEAELIVKDAELKADQMIERAQAKAIKIHEDITDMKGIKRHFKEEIRRMVESHIKMLDSTEEWEDELRNSKAEMKG